MRCSLPLVASALALSGCLGLQDNISTDTGLLVDSGAAGEQAADEGGTPTEVDLAGKLYVIAPADLVLVEPAGLNDLLHTALTQNVLMYVADESWADLLC